MVGDGNDKYKSEMASIEEAINEELNSGSTDPNCRSDKFIAKVAGSSKFKSNVK